LKEKALEVLEVVVVDELELDVDDVVDVEVVVDVETEDEDDEVGVLDEVVDLLVVGCVDEEVLVELVVELVAGEGPSAKYAPTAATAMTRTITPAKTEVLTALRR
jgi:hypothetical protein